MLHILIKDTGGYHTHYTQYNYYIDAKSIQEHNFLIKLPITIYYGILENVILLYYYIALLWWIIVINIVGFAWNTSF